MKAKNQIAGSVRRFATGFTLVELLVVIGIIALLISILLPSLRRAHEAALTTQCLSNQRQMGMFFNIYANENQGFLPPQIAGDIRLMSVATHDVLDRLSRGGAGKCFYCPTLTPPSRFLFNAPSFNPAALEWTADEQWATPACATEHVLGYFYLGNPTAGLPSISPDSYWVDVNKNGSKRDEYVEKFSEKGASHVAILTDVMPQVPGFVKSQLYLRHPADSYLKGGGTNVLYGDGHAAFVGRDDMVMRWYPLKAVGW